MANQNSPNPEQLSEKITKMSQSLASDLAQGKSPDPSTQPVMEDTSLFPSGGTGNSSPPVPPAPPHPPVSSPPPVRTPSPPLSINTGAPAKGKLGFVGILFALLGITIIIVLAVTTGLASKIVPGLGSTTITYWGLWENEAAIRPILDEFEKSHPGVKVVYQYQSQQEYQQRLQSAISQGKGPDIFRIHNTWVPMFRDSLAPVPPEIYTVSDYQKTFYPTAVNNLRLGNSLVAVPLEVDGIAMYTNDDLLQKYGQSVPQNWDQLRDAALAMSQCENISGDCSKGGLILYSGVAMGSTQNVDHWEDIIAVLMLQNNVNLSDITKPTTKPAEDVLQYFSSFAGTYHIWDPNLPNSTTNFALGKVGIYFGPSWRVFDIQAINPNLRFSIHPIPQLPVDPARGETPITYSSYWAEAVNKNSPRQKESWELVKFLSSPDIMPKLYQQEISPQRSFGEPYSRVDLADSVKNDKYVSTFISQATLARSWYLASFTHDGDQGLNSQLSNLFAQAVDRKINVTSLGVEIKKVLSAYGITAVNTSP